MADMSKCPSCGVKPSIMKIATRGNGHLNFEHLPDCQIGHAVFQKGPICCSKCNATFTLSNRMMFSYADGGGTYSLDCPICWAVAEAKGGQNGT
jgi:hypothetical protein